MGWIKGEGTRFEAGRLPDGMQELGAQIEAGHRSLGCAVGMLCWDAGLKAAAIWKQMKGSMSEAFGAHE